MKVYALVKKQNVVHGQGSSGNNWIIPHYDSYTGQIIAHPFFINLDKAEEFKANLNFSSFYKIVERELI